MMKTSTTPTKYAHVAGALLALAVGCKNTEKRKPSSSSGPPAVASCDYVADLLDGKRHSCFEIYDATTVELHAGWCKQLETKQDHPTFRRGEGCPLEGRKGGCLYPNGVIAWYYEGKPSCVLGQEFTDAPKVASATPYRCAGARLCSETTSVFDLTKTVEKQNCETIGETKFEAGSCSADNVAARCAVRAQTRDTTWLFYTPMTVDEAKQQCDKLSGTFTASQPTSGSAASVGSAGQGAAAGTAAPSSVDGR
jgi:hypothetical protein